MGEKHFPRERLTVFRFLARAGCGYAWRSLKSLVKLLIGRKIYFNDRDLFFRQYLFHLTGLRSIRGITCYGFLGEGAASQALNVMHAILFARSSGLAYLHTPFTLVHHSDRPMQEWVAAWEELFNLGEGEVPCRLKRHQVVNFNINFHELEFFFGRRASKEELAARFKANIHVFRSKYYLNRVPRMNRQLTVAVHVRRNDVSAGHYLFTKTEAIRQAILEVKSILDNLNTEYTISVYSQGNREDLPELLIPGVEFFLDADAIWTMRELIEADVLIMAKGTFSYYAGLISDGIRLCEPWLDTLDGWIVRSPDGTFDTAAFERQVVLLLQAKAKALASPNTTDPD